MDLVAPPKTTIEWAEAVYRGAGRLASRFSLAIVGGDTTSGPIRELHVFGVGRVPAGTALLRSGARPGDHLYVTGTLGGSLAGRHLAFEPRVEEGSWLREGGWASSLMDISDGLLVDLDRLLEQSRVGARLEAARIPVSDAARMACDGREPLEHALADGEDYELILTVPAKRAADFEDAWARRFPLACARIGVMTPEQGVLSMRDADGRVIRRTPGGYEHFA